MSFLIKRADLAMMTQSHFLFYHFIFISKKIYDIVRETHSILIEEAEHERVFNDLPLVSFRRAKILKDSLVRAAVPVLHTSPGCDACHMGRGIEKATSFTSTSTGRTFLTRAENLNCKSTGIVYLLQCKKCRIQNVGIRYLAFT